MLTFYSPLIDDGFPDEVAVYNKELEDLGNPTWLDVPWLFSECYMYRHVLFRTRLFYLSRCLAS